MSDILLLEFRGVGADDYQRVNAILGVDMAAGTGMPPGLAVHTGAASADGLVVLEVWDSQEDAGRFFESRLGAALDQAGVPAPTRMEWMTLEGSFVR